MLSVARREGLLEQLTDANEKLDDPEADYRITRDEAPGLPRFFFLSNDELLEILAETHDIKVQLGVCGAFTVDATRLHQRTRCMVFFEVRADGVFMKPRRRDAVDVVVSRVSVRAGPAPHMKKCFDGIAHLDFDPDLNILAALDAPPPKGERLEFTYQQCDHRMINPKDSGARPAPYEGASLSTPLASISRGRG